MYDDDDDDVILSTRCGLNDDDQFSINVNQSDATTHDETAFFVSNAFA
jgi:hypothetical protein